MNGSYDQLRCFFCRHFFGFGFHDCSDVYMVIRSKIEVIDPKRNLSGTNSRPLCAQLKKILRTSPVLTSRQLDLFIEEAKGDHIL